MVCRYRRIDPARAAGRRRTMSRPRVFVTTRFVGAPPRFSTTPDELVRSLKNFVGSKFGRPAAKFAIFVVAQPPERRMTARDSR